MSDEQINPTNEETPEQIKSIDEPESDIPPVIKAKKNRYTNEGDRRDAILKAKRSYYHRNNDLFKLKSRHRYYSKRLNIENIPEEQKTKYLTKLNEIEEEINNFNSSNEK